MRLPCGATATLFTLPSCSLKRYALRFALKFQSMIQSSSPPLTICFILGKNTALLMALRWPRKVRSSVGSIGMVEEVTTAANVNRVSGKCSFGKVHRGGAVARWLTAAAHHQGVAPRKVWISKTNTLLESETRLQQSSGTGLPPTLSHVTKNRQTWALGVPAARLLLFLLRKHLSPSDPILP